jgi:hypothetical protein
VFCPECRGSNVGASIWHGRVFCVCNLCGYKWSVAREAWAEVRRLFV